MVNVSGVLDQMKTCVIIPVYNEASTVGKILDELKNKSFEVIVIDDGSVDSSSEIAKEKGAVLIRHNEKKGKGEALRSGFRYVLQKGYDAVITMDGDGQHDVEDIGQFIKKIQECKSGIVTGTRMKNPKGMPLIRLLTNQLMSVIISYLCKQDIPDTQCGFRLITCDVLKELRFTSSDFEIETEILIKAVKKGFGIYSVPVKTIYRNEFSKIDPIIDTIRFLKYLIKEIRCSKKNKE